MFSLLVTFRTITIKNDFCYVQTIGITYTYNGGKIQDAINDDYRINNYRRIKTKNGYSSRATNLLLTLNLILMKKTQYKYTTFQVNSKFQSRIGR